MKVKQSSQRRQGLEIDDRRACERDAGELFRQAGCRIEQHQIIASVSAAPLGAIDRIAQLKFMGQRPEGIDNLL